MGLTSRGAVVEAVAADVGRLTVDEGRLGPAVGVGALGTGVFLLRRVAEVVVEVEEGVGRLGAAALTDAAELGRGLAALGLVAPPTGCAMNGTPDKWRAKERTKESEKENNKKTHDHSSRITAGESNISRITAAG